MTTSFLLPKNSLQVTRGASETINISITDSDGTPLNLTGATVYFTVKRRLTDRNCLIQKDSSVPAQITVANPTDGKAQIFILPGDTTSLDPRKYVFDVWAVTSGGDRLPVVPSSIFEVIESVTKFV